MATEETGELPVSYIVRVYRNDPPETLTGTVDVPALAKHLTFASFEELKAILTMALGREPAPRRGER